jgi:putative transposase
VNIFVGNLAFSATDDSLRQLFESHGVVDQYLRQNPLTCKGFCRSVRVRVHHALHSTSTEKPTMDIGALFQGLRPSLPSTPGRQVSRMALALRVMTGRVTLLGLSRWAGTGGSSRPVQRFFATVLPWGSLCWGCFRPHVYGPDEVSLAAGDEGIVTKTGTWTHGLERFWARLDGKPVPGLACFPVSLLSVQPRRAFPLRVAQVVRRAAAQAASKAQAAAKTPKAPQGKRRPGRPNGSTNTNKASRTLTPELVRIKAMGAALLRLLTPVLSVTSLVLDGPCGPHNALPLVPQCTWPLLAKRRGEAALSFPSTGP